MKPIQKYRTEVALFVIAMFFGFLLLAFTVIRDHKGIEKYCDNNPSHCVPAEYPGKVIYND